MKEDMRRVYEEEIDTEVQSLEEINEDEIQFIQFLKEEGIPYEKEIRSKIVRENFYSLGASSNKFLVISVPNEHVAKIKEQLPDELHDIEFRLSDLSEEELQKLNKICEEDCESTAIVEKTAEECVAEFEEAEKELKKLNSNLTGYITAGLLCVSALFIVLPLKMMPVYMPDVEPFNVPNFVVPVLFGLAIFISYKLMVARKNFTNERKKIEEDLVMPAVTSMIKPLMYKTNAAQDFTEREIAILKEMCDDEEFEIGNKISMNEGGENFAVSEIITEMYTPGTSGMETYKIRRSLIKTKSKKHMEEPLFLEVYLDEDGKNEKFMIDAYKNSYAVDNSIISTEFENKAKELDEKYGANVFLYYIGDVVYVLIDFDISFSMDKIIGGKKKDIQAEVTKHFEERLKIIREYIELAEML